MRSHPSDDITERGMMAVAKRLRPEDALDLAVLRAQIEAMMAKLDALELNSRNQDEPRRTQTGSW